MLQHRVRAFPGTAASLCSRGLTVLHQVQFDVYRWSFYFISIIDRPSVTISPASFHRFFHTAERNEYRA